MAVYNVPKARDMRQRINMAFCEVDNISLQTFEWFTFPAKSHEVLPRRILDVEMIWQRCFHGREGINDVPSCVELDGEVRTFVPSLYSF